jgi:DNA invertase Pin-like site-specific DNA recombinase
MTAPPVAYSYIRFSDPIQSKGDSVRRQTEAAEEWSRKNRIPLDRSKTLHDLGVPALLGQHRKNPDRYALAAFLKLVENGDVRPGSYLVIENLDRLSREEVVPATHLLLGILVAGVKVVQLRPAELVLTDKSDMGSIMLAVVELSRGHSESAMKSQRVSAKLARKRKALRDGSLRVLTRQLPAWVCERAGRLELVPGRAAVIRQIYDLAAHGYGASAIVKKLTADGIAPFGEFIIRAHRKRSAFAGCWIRAYVAKILRDRRAVGEFQPRKGGAPDGPPISGYFPAVVSEDEWLAARAGVSQRRRLPGRTGDRVNVFAGLLRHARDGDNYHAGRQTGGRYILVNTRSTAAAAPTCTFPLETFERALFAYLAEIDPRDVLGQDRAPDEVMVLSGELARAEASIAAINADLDEHGDTPELLKRLREKDRLRIDLAARLAEARQKAANPLSEAWGEAKSLLEVLDAAPDPRDARLRLRSAVRKIIDSIWLLVVPRGRDRFCAVQLWFQGSDRQRSYLIFHRPPWSDGRVVRPASWKPLSFADVAAPADLDLRNRSAARQLEAYLGALSSEKFRP